MAQEPRAVVEDVLPGCRVERTDGHVLVSFDTDRPALGSAVHNGGSRLLRHVLNLHVRHDPLDGPGLQAHADPEETLARYAQDLGLAGVTAGMMTAASMASLRTVCLTASGLSVAALVTAGLSNALAAGDPAACQDGAPQPAGTINQVLVVEAALTEAAFVEAVQVATEAKAGLLAARGVKSTVSGRPATGTGTDATVVVARLGPEPLHYCGKHVLLGELIARAIARALEQSLSAFA